MLLNYFNSTLFQLYAQYFTTFTNFSTKYLVMCMVYTDVSGIKYLYHICPPVRKIIHSLKLVDYLLLQADNPWYNYYLFTRLDYLFTCVLFVSNCATDSTTPATYSYTDPAPISSWSFTLIVGAAVRALWC